MKALKIILVIVGILLAVFIVAGLMGPRSYTVERSVVINKSPQTVFAHVNNFEKRQAWYIWDEMDPELQSSVEGTDGTVGAVRTWTSTKVGNGTEEITAIKPNERIDTELSFEGFASKPKAWVVLAEKAEGTEVTWGLQGENSFFFSAFGFFMGFEKSIAKQYDLGLEKLKKICEMEKEEQLTYDVQSAPFPARTYVAHRSKIEMAKIAEFYTTHFTGIVETVGAENITGQPCGLYYSWDPKEGTTDLAASIPVAKAPKMGDQYEVIEIPEGTALVIDYYGPYDKVDRAHDAMARYLKANKLTRTEGLPAIEEYITDPTTESDPNKWLTKVYYFAGAVE